MSARSFASGAVAAVAAGGIALTPAVVPKPPSIAIPAVHLSAAQATSPTAADELDSCSGSSTPPGVPLLACPGSVWLPFASTGLDDFDSVAGGLALGANEAVPTIRAIPFGSPGTITDQPGLAIALANGNLVVPTDISLGFATPMAQGNMVGPATTTTPLSGGIRTRHGRTAGTSLSGALGGRLG